MLRHQCVCAGYQPRQVRMKDADYYTKYAENMETENVIIDMYEDIREILVRAGIDILPKK